MMATLQHVTGVALRRYRSGRAWVAYCSCGWEGPLRHSLGGEITVERDVAVHLAEVE